MRRALVSAVVWLAVSTLPTFAAAQAPPPTRTATPSQEGIDTTRLDVERLPAEAIPFTRSLYAHGLFVEAHVGGLGWYGGVGRLASPGVSTQLALGYEIFDWLWALIGAEGSIHQTTAPPPPAPSTFEVLGGFAELRVQINFDARFAMWAGGQFGLGLATGDILSTYGVTGAGSIAPNFGGRIGIDWHFLHRHYSIGISGGVRLFPGLNGFNGELAIGISGDAYLRYVF